MSWQNTHEFLFRLRQFCLACLVLYAMHGSIQPGWAASIASWQIICTEHRALGLESCPKMVSGVTWVRNASAHVQVCKQYCRSRNNMQSTNNKNTTQHMVHINSLTLWTSHDSYNVDVHVGSWFGMTKSSTTSYIGLYTITVSDVHCTYVCEWRKYIYIYIYTCTLAYRDICLSSSSLWRSSILAGEWVMLLTPLPLGVGTWGQGATDCPWVGSEVCTGQSPSHGHMILEIHGAIEITLCIYTSTRIIHVCTLHM